MYACMYGHSFRFFLRASGSEVKRGDPSSVLSLARPAPGCAWKGPSKRKPTLAFFIRPCNVHVCCVCVCMSNPTPPRGKVDGVRSRLESAEISWGEQNTRKNGTNKNTPPPPPPHTPRRRVSVHVHDARELLRASPAVGLPVTFCFRKKRLTGRAAGCSER